MTMIKPAEYKKANIAEVAESQQHLTLNERNKLRTLLEKFQPLFMGNKGNYTGPPIQLELVPDATPF